MAHPTRTKPEPGPEPLTTIRQDFTAVGRLSFQKLLGKVNATAGSGGKAPDKTVVPTELVVRRSTSRPRA